MKFIRIVSLLFFVMISMRAFSQKYHISETPVEGYFYVDTLSETVCRNPNKCVHIVSENKTVYSSGKGSVIYCYPHADKTSEVGIKYGSMIVIYANIINRRVYKSQLVDKHVPIGELLLNPRDKRYHLGLQVVKADNPKELLWGSRLVQFLNATPVLLADAGQ